MSLSIVLKFSSARWVDSRPVWSGAGTRPGWRKNKGRKNLMRSGGLTRWPGWPGKTQSKTRLQPVNFCFCFFIKTMLFWFIKKIDPNNLVTQSKPGAQALNRAGSENYGCETILNIIYFLAKFLRFLVISIDKCWKMKKYFL